MSTNSAPITYPAPLAEEVSRGQFNLLVEESGGRKRLYMEGEFAKAGVPTSNGRLYSRELWEQSLAKVQSKIERRGWYGELDHPGPNETTKLQRVSHVVVEAKVLDDGRVWGKAEILPTPNGKILAQLIESGCEVGVSSRGRGKEIRNANGVSEVDAKTYMLKAFDFVADPAQITSLPTAMYESADSATDASITESLVDYPDVVSELMRDVSEQEMDEKLADLASTVEKNLRREFEKVLAEEVDRVREEVRQKTIDEMKDGLRAELAESIRAELETSDPVIGSSRILGQIHALTRPFVTGDNEADALRAQVAKLNEENEQLVQIASGMGRRIILSEETDGHPFKDSILAILEGQTFETQDDLRNRVQIIKSQFDRLPAPPSKDDENRRAIREKIESEIEAKYKAQLDERDSTITAYRESVDRLEERFKALVDQNESLRERAAILSSQLEESRRYVNRNEVALALQESGGDGDGTGGGGGNGVDPTTIGVRRMTDPMLDNMRTKLSRGKKGGTFRDIVEGAGDGSGDDHERPGSRSRGGDVIIKGYTLDDFAKLAGIPDVKRS